MRALVFVCVLACVLVEHARAHSRLCLCVCCVDVRARLHSSGLLRNHLAVSASAANALREDDASSNALIASIAARTPLGK